MDELKRIIATLITATKIFTGKARLSYAHLLEPNSFYGAEAKYSASIIIPKSDTQSLEVIQQAIDNAIKKGIETYGKAFEGGRIHNPLHDGDIEKSGDPAYADSYFLNASNKIRPQVIDLKGKILTDPSEVYSGMYAQFSLEFFPYNVSGAGISVRLGNVLKLEDGEPLGKGSGPVSAAKEFGIKTETAFEDFFK